MSDTDGHVLAVTVHAASIQDRDGAKPLLRASRRLWCFVRTVFADGGYAGKLVEWARDKTHLSLQIVKRPVPCLASSRCHGAGSSSAASWLIKHRRLLRDLKQRTDVAETLILIAATETMLRRIA